LIQTGKHGKKFICNEIAVRGASGGICIERTGAQVDVSFQAFFEAEGSAVVGTVVTMLIR
jgi:hypothetical protein